MSIKAELQSRELQLERERAAAEIQLEREKAEAKIAVETMLAQAQMASSGSVLRSKKRRPRIRPCSRSAKRRTASRWPSARRKQKQKRLE
jgi:hypothetical protein